MWKANKFVNILLWVLAVISVVLCVYAFIRCGGLNAITQKDEMLGVISPMFMWMYVLIGITALLAILLPIPKVIENPKAGKGILLGLVAFAVVVGLAFLMAKDTQLPFTPGHAPVSGETLKFADVNLISSYIMLGATVVALVVMGVRGILKTK